MGPARDAQQATGTLSVPQDERLGCTQGTGKKCPSFEAEGVHVGAITDALAMAVKNASDIRHARDAVRR